MTRPRLQIANLLTSIRNQILKSIADATWLSAIGTLAQSFTAVVALYIAWQANETVREFRAEDRANAELQIMPRLIFEIDKGGEISVVNHGLGPALIKSVFINNNGTKSLLEAENVKWKDLSTIEQNYLSVAEFMFDKDAYKSILKTSGREGHFDIDAYLPFPGNVIPKDTSKTVMKAIFKDLSNESGSIKRDYNVWINRFQVRSTAYNVGICYCTLTNKSCFMSDLGQPRIHYKIEACNSKIFELESASVEPKAIP